MLQLDIDIIVIICNNDYNVSGTNTGNVIPKNMKRNSKKITIRDVARAAGVSVSTVSRVLNHKDDVSEETIQKIRSIVHELGYASSLAARGMRSRRTNVIGLVMPDVATPYCQHIMLGVNRAISRLEKNLIIYTSGNWPKENIAQNERSYVSLLNGGITDGLIVVTPTATDFATHAPVVIIDPNTETPNYPAVIATNREGSLAAMNYLIGLGHRRIAHITGRLNLISSHQRLQGYKDGLAAAGIPYDEDLVAIGDYNTDTAICCARKLLSLPNRPTAIFAANDMSAVGVYQVAREMGLRIPEDLSVVGFDNLRESALMVPALTTVDQFIEEMGFVATEMIVKLVDEEPLPENLRVFQTQLIVRESCTLPIEKIAQVS